MPKWVGYLASLLAVAGLVATTVNPAVQGFWSAHPVLAAVVGMVTTAAAHFAPSPGK